MTMISEDRLCGCDIDGKRSPFLIYSQFVGICAVHDKYDGMCTSVELHPKRTDLASPRHVKHCIIEPPANIENASVSTENRFI